MTTLAGRTFALIKKKSDIASVQLHGLIHQQIIFPLKPDHDNKNTQTGRLQNIEIYTCLSDLYPVGYSDCIFGKIIFKLKTQHHEKEHG